MPLPPTSQRFPISPDWRYVATNLDSETLTFLSRIALGREFLYHLYGPASASLTVPSNDPEVNILALDDDPFVANNDRLLYAFRREDPDPGVESPWVVRFAGVMQQLHDVADQERSRTTIAAYDPWQYLFNRPVVVNAVGTLPTLDGYQFFDTDPGLIAAALLADSIASHGPTRIDAGVTYQGTAFWDGEIETGLPGIDINFQRGISVGEAWQQIIATGGCDILLTPIYDPINRPGYLCDLSILEQAGSTRNNAVFAWDQPSHSAASMDRLEDGAQLANKIQFYAGQGGTPIPSLASTFPTVTNAASVAKYGQYWATQAFPSMNANAEWGKVALQAQAAAQLILRKNGKTTVTFTPVPEHAPELYREYWLGDRVPVYASSNFRKELSPPPTDSGPQTIVYERVYSVQLSISDDGVEAPALTLSPDGFT